MLTTKASDVKGHPKMIEKTTSYFSNKHSWTSVFWNYKILELYIKEETVDELKEGDETKGGHGPFT